MCPWHLGVQNGSYYDNFIHESSQLPFVKRPAVVSYELPFARNHDPAGASSRHVRVLLRRITPFSSLRTTSER